MNGIRYRAMINQFLFLKMNDIDADDICFQQDGATCQRPAVLQKFRTVSYRVPLSSALYRTVL